MNNLKEEVLEILSQVKGSGKYVSAHVTDFVFPNLEVDSLGELSFPINEMLAKSLIHIAQKAPFGIGQNTITDNSIRSAWEIDAHQLHFKGKAWETFLNNVIEKTKEDLGIEDYEISSHLYKMLIYETGDFFLPHRDSEKEKGMFGTMVVTLPSKYVGGDLIVKFEGEEENIDFSQASADNKLCTYAFYADCEHEIKPLISGYRVCLVYNLLQKQSGKVIPSPSATGHISRLARSLSRQIKQDSSKPVIVLLGHQYTPENFSLDALKLNDRYRADILLQAAKEINCYAKMCLVTSYKMGTPEYDNYDDDDFSDDEETEISEVIDEWISIEHWLENNIPSLDEIRCEESDLITSYALDEDEPIVKENSGYMGNYGPDIEHWYHYGAVMIWSHETNAQLIFPQKAPIKLEWIDYFSKNLDTITEDEISAVEKIIDTRFNQDNFDNIINYDAVVNWIMSNKNENFFSTIDAKSLIFYFTRISSAQWIKLLTFLPTKNAHDLVDVILHDTSVKVFEQLLDLLNTMLNTKALPQFATLQISKLPACFEMVLEKTNDTASPLSKTAAENLIAIDNHSKQNDEWINRMAELLPKCVNANYLNNALVPALLNTNNKTDLVSKTLKNCKVHYQKITDIKPLPPENWTRKMPTETYHKKQWDIIKSFLESPIEINFEYRKLQSDRSEMEAAIKNVAIDLQLETIKKGTPHTLLITKTQDEYKKKLRQWNRDLVVLANIIQKIEE